MPDGGRGLAPAQPCLPGQRWLHYGRLAVTSRASARGLHRLASLFLRATPWRLLLAFQLCKLGCLSLDYADELTDQLNHPFPDDFGSFHGQFHAYGLLPLPV